MKSVKNLIQEHKFDKDKLLKVFHDCINYYLSEDELNEFILEYYIKKEERINKRLQV